jgi:ornithine decarboxylase
MNSRQLQALAREHGTPIVVIDHDELRKNYANFRRHLPKVQAYYAVKANPAPEIIRTLYRAGASFDVASLPEFMLVYENIRELPPKKRQDFIWDKIVYANPIKPQATLEQLDQYRPLVTYDNREELHKIKRFAPNAGLVLRLKVPNTGSVVELSSKFGCDPGEAVDLIVEAFGMGLIVEGLSFHVGSQCSNFQNFVQALNISAALMREAKSRGHEIKILDIGGGFPVRYNRHVQPFSVLARRINAEVSRLFPPDIEILAETLSQPPQPASPPSSARPFATANPLTTSTTASITPSPVSSLTIASTLFDHFAKELPRLVPSSARPATDWTQLANQSRFPNSR